MKTQHVAIHMRTNQDTTNEGNLESSWNDAEYDGLQDEGDSSGAKSKHFANGIILRDKLGSTVDGPCKTSSMS